jgi:hypothetical protein
LILFIILLNFSSEARPKLSGVGFDTLSFAADFGAVALKN